MLGNLVEMRRNFIQLLTESVTQYGDIVRLRLGREAYLFNHPDQIAHILIARPELYRRSFVYDRMRVLVGNGLVTSEGDLWRRQRRLAQPAFHKHRISEFGALIVRRADQMVDRWLARSSGESLSLHEEMLHLTLGIAGEALMGVDLHGEAELIGRAATDALAITDSRILSLVPMPLAIPSPENIRLRRALRTLNSVVDEMISQRRSGPPRLDLLSMLIEARDEDGEGMSDELLRDEVMTMLLAGHETTASALAFTLHLVAEHSEQDARLGAELERVLSSPPTMDDLPHLRYASMVVSEGLRLFPPAWLVSREAIQHDEVAGYPITPGTTILLSPLTTHRHPAFWSNPNEFRPERFESDEGRPKMAFFPFGAGPRMCLGAGLAVFEMQLVVATIRRRLRLVAAGPTPTPIPRLTLRPSTRMPVTFVQTRGRSSVGS